VGKGNHSDETRGEACPAGGKHDKGGKCSEKEEEEERGIVMGT